VYVNVRRCEHVCIGALQVDVSGCATKVSSYYRLVYPAQHKTHDTRLCVFLVSIRILALKQTETHTRTQTQAHTQAHAHTNTHMHTQTHTCTHKQTYMQAHTHTPGQATKPTCSTSISMTVVFPQCRCPTTATLRKSSACARVCVCMCVRVQ
jgi:hypothetical protein